MSLTLLLWREPRPFGAAGRENYCGGMPVGAAADAIQSSGLTALHEWVITCFYDSVMPQGYRESL